MVFSDYSIPVVWLLGAASPLLLLAHIRTRRPLLLWLGCLSGAPFLLATLGAAVFFISGLIQSSKPRN